jgi:hypothetical protein
MAQLKVSLSIGMSRDRRHAVIEVDNDELAECETEEAREELLYSYWKAWADNYINVEFELVEEG